MEVENMVMKERIPTIVSANSMEFAQGKDEKGKFIRVKRLVTKKDTGSFFLLFGMAEVEPGYSMPFDYDYEEVIYMREGSLKISWGDNWEKTVTVNKDEAIFMPTGRTYLFENPGSEVAKTTYAMHPPFM